MVSLSNHPEHVMRRASQPATSLRSAVKDGDVYKRQPQAILWLFAGTLHAELYRGPVTLSIPSYLAFLAFYTLAIYMFLYGIWTPLRMLATHVRLRRFWHNLSRDTRLLGFLPVSYTHLDVYKRQGTRNASQETRHALQITFARPTAPISGTARIENATLERIGNAAFLFL